MGFNVAFYLLMVGCFRFWLLCVTVGVVFECCLFVLIAGLFGLLLTDLLLALWFVMLGFCWF